MAETTTTQDVQALSFEAAMQELESLVTRLEGGKIALEESISLYERGQALKEHCAQKLRQAEEKIACITLSPEGAPEGTVPFKE